MAGRLVMIPSPTNSAELFVGETGAAMPQGGGRFMATAKGQARSPSCWIALTVLVIDKTTGAVSTAHMRSDNGADQIFLSLPVEGGRSYKVVAVQSGSLAYPQSTDVYAEAARTANEPAI
jgi:hypothetical protein